MLYSLSNGISKQRKIELISFLIEYIKNRTARLKHIENTNSKCNAEIRGEIEAILHVLIPNEKLYEHALYDVKMGNYRNLSYKILTHLN
jgi:hypothetical protein